MQNIEIGYTFEEGVARLQSLVEALEQGSMPLEESFAAYEQAAHLLDQLNRMLDEGEKRIALLTPAGETEITGEVCE